jgi:hypothetical protein
MILRGPECLRPFTWTHLPSELQRLMATAVAVIDRHINAAGRCRECAQQWPCSSARLADLTLGGF